MSILHILLDLGNRDKKLFEVVPIDREGIEMAEDTPVGQMGNQTGEFGSGVTLDMTEGFFDIRFLQVRLGGHQSEVAYLLLTPEVDFTGLKVILPYFIRTRLVIPMGAHFKRRSGGETGISEGLGSVVIVDDVDDLPILVTMRDHFFREPTHETA
jgi:hypothetical protein